MGNTMDKIWRQDKGKMEMQKEGNNLKLSTPGVKSTEKRKRLNGETRQSGSQRNKGVRTSRDKADMGTLRGKWKEQILMRNL